VPVAASLPVFERAWVLSTVAGAGLVRRAGRDLVRGLRAAFGPAGVAAGPGLPPDADDTATGLTALALLGEVLPPDCLWSYREPDGHFACFHGERTPSTSANAHVLQAFGECGSPDPRRSEAMARLVAWLCEHQEPDGSWWDKWHASPYYATACCVLALAGHGGDRATEALRRAMDWVIGTQRPHGSWGRWAGTYEETAYAVRVLARFSGTAGRAVAAGRARLLRDPGGPYPPLWHDKDLYTPVRVVRAEGLAALHVTAGEPCLACPPGEGSR
jgi:hypothetical protein